LIVSSGHCHYCTLLEIVSLTAIKAKLRKSLEGDISAYISNAQNACPELTEP
jgi:hypothetical protein